MADTCNEVCDEVIRRLKGLGFDVGDDEDHQPIFDALQEVVFIRDDQYGAAVSLADAVINWFGTANDGGKFYFGDLMNRKAKEFQELSKYGQGGRR